MRILHVVAALTPAGGGLSELVPHMALEAVRLGKAATIATVARAGERLSAAAEGAAAGGVRLARFAPSFPRSLFASWEMRRCLQQLVDEADVVHVHSNWTFPVWWAGRCAVRAGKPLVMSPQGCLDPVRLGHSAWKKRLAGMIDRRLLRQADVIHATTEAEREWIERYVGTAPRIVVIPNGVEMPVTPPCPIQPKPPGRVRRVLSLGRLHPLKGLDLLVDAWQRVATRWPRNGGPGAFSTVTTGWELVIAGPDEQGTRARLKARASSLGLRDVSFSGPLYGVEKAAAFAAADLFVLPSRTENFGIVAAEALAAGVPVIATKGTPWSDIDGRSGWWVDVDADAIASALVAAMQLTDEDRKAMGERGRRLVADQYQWTTIGHRMTTLYAELIADSPD